jgi:3-phosphoshikimate 1-carboxyvinyltransferase
VHCPDVIIPPDASMIVFARLAGLEIDNMPKDSELIGNEILNSVEEFDLTDANDLITPLAAILALQGGGRITGAAHAAFKESNRVTRTVSMLADFGLVVIPTDDGLIIEGGQRITKPKGIVKTYSDHRIQMTAILLATKVGAVVEGMKLHEIAWPSYLEQLQKNGLKVESRIVQP